MFKQVSGGAVSYLDRHATELHGAGVSFHIHYWGVNPMHYDNPLHKHSFFEMCYVLDGEGMYIDDGVEYPIRSNSLFCSRPGIWHQIRSEDGLFLLYVAFEVVQSTSSEEAVEQFRHLQHSKSIHLGNAEYVSTALIWKALLVQSAKSQTFLQEMITDLAHNLLVSTVQTFSDYEKSRHERSYSSATTQLHQAKLFIRDNLSQRLRLDDVAGYLHVSGRHLSRLFSKEQGQTFVSYVREQRIEQAKTMLKTNHLTIHEIARETGFDTIHYFTRVFTQEVGTPPVRYRNQMLNLHLK